MELYLAIHTCKEDFGSELNITVVSFKECQSYLDLRKIISSTRVSSNTIFQK